MHALISPHREAIAELCRRHDVLRLDAFGSAARAVDFDPERRDADFLVEFKAGHGRPSLRRYFALREELSRLLWHSVDLIMAGSVINPFIRAEIDPHPWAHTV